MSNLKSGVDSLDQQIGSLSMLESVITQWELKQKNGDSDDYFSQTLEMFKTNLEKHITFLKQRIEEAA
jgi:hypothetical protein